jgi:hypothetical protein
VTAPLTAEDLADLRRNLARYPSTDGHGRWELAMTLVRHLPALLSEVERLRAVEADLRAAIDERDRALAEAAKAKQERDELLRAASGLAIHAAGRVTK